MGTFSIWHWLIVLAVVLILFGGRGKIANIMGDVGKGLKDFKKNVKDDSPDDVQATAQLRENQQDNDITSNQATKTSDKSETKS